DLAALGGDVDRADGELVGLAGVVGVLAHGGGELLHRRGGFLERGGLLFGAARQIVVAGRDLGGGGADRVGRLLDPGDDAGELPDGGVGVVAHGREHALVFAVHAHGQVAVGQRGQHVRDLLQARGVRVEQAVELGGQL